MSDEQNIPALMQAIGRNARKAAIALAEAAPNRKHAALIGMAEAVRANSAKIIAANAEDLAYAKQKGLTDAMIDRLVLNEERILGIVESLRAIAEAHDPVGEVIAQWERPSGLNIRRVRTPIGVVAVIYESRPNVTADAGALCLKSGNAAILRGGSESYHSSKAIHECLKIGLRSAGLPEESIQLTPTRDRAAVGEILAGLDGAVDVIVPRGGKGLVGRVQKEARAPVFAHLEGICHVYVDAAADPEKARKVALNAKMRRTGVCGAAECLLIDASAKELGAEIVGDLLDAGCEVRGDATIAGFDSRVKAAAEEDFGCEFLDTIIAAKIVDGVGGAVEHIRRYSSGHTEAILTEDDAAAAEFVARIDSAILMRNASTQFADGGEFGMGAEIGIATGKMHARGPVGAEQLTSFKYIVEGDGTTRP